jgi:serine phosphatase RsbU (regulator of sigma subunit)/anti-sigma regulatory factor (Ser/Thr protein kinase)
MGATTLQPDRPATLRLAFPPDLAAARAAAGTVRRFFAEQGGSEQELFACELCVAEACNNAVEYASDFGKEHHAFVDAVCSATLLELRVSDHTGGFDWPKNLTKAPQHAERGRGLFIINSFMDEVVYLRGAKENVLIMRKKRTGPPPAHKHNQEDEPRTFQESKTQLSECKRAVSAMARELCFRTETLAAIFRCCADVGRSGDNEGFAARIIDDMLHLTSADWYVLRFCSGDQTQLIVTSASETAGTLPALVVPSEAGAASGIEARVAATKTASHYSAGESVASEPLRSVGERANGVVYPLVFNDALVGTISVGRSDGEFVFGEAREEVVRAFAEFLAIQTAGLRHREEELKSQLFSRELDIARVIQRSLLPVTIPQVPGFGLAGGWHCAREVGGDFYDAIALSEHRLLLIVADVMGKGVPAALFATNLRGLLRGLSARFDDPAQLLGRLNRLLYEELSAVSMFITAQVVVVDSQTRVITAAGAGHCPLLYVTEDGETVAPLATQGMPLGVLPNVEYRSRSVTLGSPGTLLLYTDGLTDVRNAAGATFGQARLTDWLAANHGRGRSATELRGRLASELNRHRGDAAMSDDQAFLLLTEEPHEDSRDTASWFPHARPKRVEVTVGV